MSSASVIVCAYTEDRWDALLRSLRSVLEQEPRPREVVACIDHNPGLATRLRAELTDEPLVRVIESDGPRGLSGARNAGWAATTGDVVVFLDDDAWAEPGWLASLLAPYDDARVRGVGGRVVPAWMDGRPRWFPAQFDWVVGCTYEGMPLGPEATVRNPIGANMSFRRDVIERVGGFRAELGRVGTRPSGCEETELCIRLVAELPDARLVYADGAVVHHEVPEARGRLGYFGRRCFAEGSSKAQVSDRVGSKDALSSERDYLVRALTGAVARDLVPPTTAGVLRSATIVFGVGATGAGYLGGRVRSRREPRDERFPVTLDRSRSGPA